MRVGVTLSAGAALWLAAWTVATQGDVDQRAKTLRIARLVRQLGDASYSKRAAASKELATIGEPALAALRAAATSDNQEVRRRAEQAMRIILPSLRKSTTLEMSLARIDPGEFPMGSPPREAGRRPDEVLHNARIAKTFYLGIHEVTQGEYARVMKVNPSWFARSGNGSDRVVGADTNFFPVERVTWFDAVEFCNRLSELDGYPPYYLLAEIRRLDDAIIAANVTILGGGGYRLPTEAEWEFACRADSKTRFHFGATTSGREANFKVVVGGGYGGPVEVRELMRPTRVGAYPANAWGLHDMHGSVAEWCEDWYGLDYYHNAPLNDPKGPAQGTHRVIRGGNWLLGEASCRSASRASQLPDERTYFTGFRVARTP